MLVSDAIPLAGMGDGRATVGGLEVEVVGQRVTVSGLDAAGSVIALDDAVRNLVNVGVSLPAAVAAASRNPLAMLGSPIAGGSTSASAPTSSSSTTTCGPRVMRGGTWFEGARLSLSDGAPGLSLGARRLPCLLPVRLELDDALVGQR